MYGRIEGSHMGRFEAKIKNPDAAGFWPAFWLFSAYPDDNGVLDYNEIDIFEFWSQRNPWNNSQITNEHSNGTIQTNSHANKDRDFQPDGDPNNETCPQSYRTDYFNPVVFSQNFHEYAFEWNNFRMDWFVDNQVIRTETKFSTLFGQPLDCNSLTPGNITTVLISDFYPIEIYHHIILNCSVLKNKDGPPDEEPPASVFPIAMETQYLRYYMRVPCNGPQVINNTTELNLSNEDFNLLAGSSVTMQNNVLISNYQLPWGAWEPQQLRVIARDEITLGPGFTVWPNNDFVASINPQYCSSQIISNSNQTGVQTFTTKNSFNQKEIVQPTEDVSETEIVVAVYPNPVVTELSIDILNLQYEEFTVEIKTADGKTVKRLGVIDKDNKYTFNLSSLNSGVYLLQFINKNGLTYSTRKLIKL